MRQSAASSSRAARNFVSTFTADSYDQKIGLPVATRTPAPRGGAGRVRTVATKKGFADLCQTFADLLGFACKDHLRREQPKVASPRAMQLREGMIPQILRHMVCRKNRVAGGNPHARPEGRGWAGANIRDKGNVPAYLRRISFANNCGSLEPRGPKPRPARPAIRVPRRLQPALPPAT